MRALNEASKGSRWVAALVLVAGLATGIGGTWWKLSERDLEQNFDGWMASPHVGSTEADAMTRARVAVSGLLALNKSQVIYFTRNTDSSGKRLRAECRYHVAGHPLPGEWWSVIVFAPDNFLPQNDDDALSFDKTEIIPDANGNWSASLTPKREGDTPWASTRNAGNYSLSLKIYQPTPEAQNNFASVALPTITKLDCGGKS